MPRNGSGSYQLPAGNPVTSGTLIEASWANTTLSDLASAMTDSLARSGEGGMTGPLRATDGSVSVPSLSFGNETSTGFYRAAATNVRFAMAGVDVATITPTGVGIGTSSPGAKLEVSGGDVLLRGGKYVVGPTVGGNGAGAIRGTLNGVLGSMIFQTENSSAVLTDVMTLDSSGNLGLGVTPSAWGSTYKAFQIGLGGGVWGRTNSGTQVGITSNVYNDNGVERRIVSDFSAEYLQASGAHYWYTAPSGTAGNPITFTQAMTLDASGRLGIGTSSPSTELHVAGDSVTEVRIVSSGDLTSTAASIVRFGGSNSAVSGYVGYGGTASTFDLWNSLNGAMTFGTNGIERARITSNGDFCIGKTNASELVASGTGYGFSSSTTDPFFSVVNTNAAGNNGCIYLNKRNTNPSNSLIVFISNNGTTDSGVGSITHNGTSTAYNTSSDYRLKENIQPMTGALAKVAQLKPCTYTWKSTGTAGQGFIAHELAEVVPDAVTGEKDAVNEDGSIKPQGIDTSFLVATLTAAIKEQQAIITQLTARIEALEAAAQ